MGRQDEIVEAMRAEIAVAASESLKLWRSGQIDERAMAAALEAALTVGLKPLMGAVTAYGDRELLAACAEIREKMGAALPDVRLEAAVRNARRQAAYMPGFSPPAGGWGGAALRAQASEMYLRRRKKAVSKWSRDTAFEFGIHDLDATFGGVQEGEICVLSGGEGSMKTSLALRGVENALEKGLSVMFYSLDMDAGEIQERRLLTRLGYAQRFYIYLLQAGDTKEIDEREAEMVELDRGKLILCGKEDGAATVDGVRERVLSRRPNVLVVDYLTRLKRKGQSDLECVDEAMPEILSFTQAAGCRTVLLSQMSRASKSEQAKGVTGGHAKGGGVVEELAHVEVELMKDFSGNPDMPELIATVSKNRRGDSRVSFSLGVDYAAYGFSGQAKRVYRSRSPKERPLWVKEKPCMAEGGASDA
jgi:KaiC/GvpD/RAD55 family RecA-like ATPase